MPHSDDDFGLDDEDTAFLDAATQAEASQFDPSPRPAKRRRVSREGLDGNDEEPEWSQLDGENNSSPRASTYFQSTAAPTQGTAAAPQDDFEPEDGDQDYYLPGELEPVDRGKNSRFKIHVPEKGGKFPDQIFSQIQHNLGVDPARFRGAVWKRPPAQPAPNVGGIANANGYGNGAVRPGANGIANYFQAVGRGNEIDGDAALAARLQEEENARAKQNRPPPPLFDMTQQEMATQLADLPDDAFSSSSPEKSPTKDVIDLSQYGNSQPQRQQPQTLRGPQTGLKQMTIYGQAATQELSASQAANKRHAWPLMSKDEPPTHHKLDGEAMRTWVYPTNLGTIRDYQFNIVSRSLFHNTLVALPTGLGKTFIAATVMLNYYRWTTNAQVVFMAPTKPLIAQQMDACYGIVGIPRRDTVLMTGETVPALRADEWLEKRVFFMTPQTVINDLKTGICDPKRIVLLVVDEAHKATGGFAYTEVVSFMRRFNSSFRVLALTATPGSTTEAVQAVIDNLGIARVELRTEQSLDIRQYTHEKLTETEIFDLSDEQQRIMDLMSKALRPSLEKLCSQNAYWSRDAMQLTAYGLTTQRQKWMQSDAGRKAPQMVKGMINAIFTVLSSLAHSITLLKFHGIGPFYSGVLAFQRSVESGEQKGKTAAGIAQGDDFTKMISTMRTWTNNLEFIGHPKLEYLREVVLNHFLDAGEGRQGSDVPPSATRVMIFASYRDSTEEICRVLKRSEPMIRPHVFVGQAASKGQEGMDQKKQNAVIQDFKSGKYNTLIATSIGEEGLDIGTVDLIICYDASSSPIRMLQRIGRTGRKRTGRVVLLLMKGKEEADYAKAQDNYLYIQKTIADTSKYSYRDDQSPRILPKEVRPVADKRPVEIPIENSQPIDLNEKGKRARGKAKTKRPPKKFHMPDNVRTGFVSASRLGEASDEAEDAKTKKKKPRAEPKKKTFKMAQIPDMLQKEKSPPPDPAPLPCLADVFLTDAQLEELAQKYTQPTADDDEIIHPPDIERFPETLRELGPTKHLQHGRRALLVEKTMKAVHDFGLADAELMEDLLHLSDVENTGVAGVRLVSPEAERLIRPPEPRRAPSPIPVVAKKPRGRPKKVASPPRPMVSDPESESEAELPARPPPRAPPAKTSRAAPAKKPRGRPQTKKALQRVASYGSAAEEGAESSPEPTPADMRIGTQGIDLGSRDTSGEDEEEEPSSDDLAFLANSSDPPEMRSSSSVLRTPVEKKRRGLKNRVRRQTSLESIVEVMSDDERESIVDVSADDDHDDDGDEEAVPVAKGRRRMIVQDSDEDDE